MDDILETLEKLEVDIDKLHDVDCKVSYEEIERAIKLVRDIKDILEN